ncbi:hypothetical protein HMSSN139_06430 [Paenibacillus sp. HMSSN-139]|nr:hypothetical protein HMSSN139_06430 [Paenibacillus sp. HMSSN-139]
MTTSYHRAPLLYQDATYVGFGKNGRTVVIDISTDTGQVFQSVVWPYDGQDGIDTTFYGFEDSVWLE